MVLEAHGEILSDILGGTFKFKLTHQVVVTKIFVVSSGTHCTSKFLAYMILVAHFQGGAEIAYNGPFDICCDLFSSTVCAWEVSFRCRIFLRG